MSEKDGGPAQGQMSEPVAWMTPGGDVSRSLAWCKERCWPDGEQPMPLYASSRDYAQGVADAARVCREIWQNAPNDRPEYRQNEISHGCLACEQAIRALSSPPSVSEEWVEKIIDDAGMRPHPFSARIAIKAALAALGIEVTK